MEKKINIAQLLKDCPQGMELDCTICEDVYFDYVGELDIIYCYIQYKTHKTSITFNQHGTLNNDVKSKCVIFPKGKTTWEGFVPDIKPKFKNGDIIYNRLQKKICIYYLYEDEVPRIRYCRYNESNIQLQFEKLEYPIPIVVQDYRLATEEEKQKLFRAIKDNGYKWNEETKLLENLIEPKFKVGNRITKRGSIENSWIVSSVSSECYGLQLPNDNDHIGVLPVCEQDKWELVPDVKPTFKVGDKIKHKENPWVCTIRRVEDRYYVDGHPTCYTILFDKQGEWELVSDKFDINTLKPFDKVLVRTSIGYWRIQFFERINKKNKNYPFVCMNENNYNQCIPYEGNEHLFGTTNDCDEFYKTW